MDNKFSTLTSDDVFSQKNIGRGTTSVVYPHPSSSGHVVRMPIGYAAGKDLWKQVDLEPVSLPKNIDGRFGVAQFESKGGMQIAPKVVGENVSYMGDMTPREYVKQVNTLRKMPQEAYTKMRRDMRTITNSGGFLDAYPANVKVGSNRFNLLDVGEPTDFASEGRDTSRWKQLSAKEKNVNMINQITGLASNNDVQAAMPEMSNKRQQIVRRGLNNIFGKLSIAGKKIPAIGAILGGASFLVNPSVGQAAEIGAGFTPAAPIAEWLNPRTLNDSDEEALVTRSYSGSW